MCDIKDTNQNCIPEEDTEQLAFGECLLPFATEYFSARVQCKDINIKIHKTIIFLLFL